MGEAQIKLVTNPSFPAERHGKHKLDEMDPRLARHIVVFRPSLKVMAAVLEEARLSIPGLAETNEVVKLFEYNPECIWALARKSKFNPDDPAGVGFIAMLPLNMLGLQHLALGTFNAGSPDTRLLAGPGERPAGVYLWGVYAPGSLVAGMALFMEKMATPQYDGVDIYSRPNTEVGVRFNHGMGFVKGTKVGDIEAPNVWKFSRAPAAPLYDSYVPNSGTKDLGITVARTFDDLMKVAAIRNSVYIGEQKCPYDEEYDGNDFSATHLLAYLGDEPVGCLRLRFFGDFAKFERLAVRREFRDSRIAIQLTRAGLRLCQKKGYTRAMAHIQRRLVPFWTRRFGFRPTEGRAHFAFSDYDYVEIESEIERDPDAITVATDPYVVIRPEGRWHRPGILEQSAARAVTNGSENKKQQG